MEKEQKLGNGVDAKIAGQATEVGEIAAGQTQGENVSSGTDDSAQTETEQRLYGLTLKELHNLSKAINGRNPWEY